MFRAAPSLVKFRMVRDVLQIRRTLATGGRGCAVVAGARPASSEERVVFVAMRTIQRFDG
jgi:hypothetical protein